MYRVQFYVGLDRDKGGRTILPSAAVEAQERVEGFLSATYGGFTRVHGVGVDSSGKDKLSERTAIYTVLSHEDENTEEKLVRRLANYVAGGLRVLCDQSSVLYTVEKVHGEFV